MLRMSREAPAMLTGQSSNHIEPTFGSVRLTKLNTKTLQIWLDELTVRYAPSTVHNIFRVLNSILSKAVDQGLIQKESSKRHPEAKIRGEKGTISLKGRAKTIGKDN